MVFEAMKEFEKAAQSQRLARTSVSRSTDRKFHISNSTLEDFSRVSDPVADTKSNSYALIAERRLQLESEAQLKSRSLLSERLEKKSISGSNKQEKVCRILHEDKFLQAQSSSLYRIVLLF